MIAAGVSLLLAVGCVWFWVWMRDALYLAGWGVAQPGREFWTFGSGGGRFQLVYDNGTRYMESLGHWEIAGFEYGTYSNGWNVWVPWWFPTLLFLIAPARWAYRTWRGAKRGMGGICPVSGYDLRATPARCPECGHIPNTQGTSRYESGISAYGPEPPG